VDPLNSVLLTKLSVFNQALNLSWHTFGAISVTESSQKKAETVHIPDGILNPYACTAMYVAALLFLIWAWRGAKRTLPRTFIPLIAIISAIVLVVQLVEFPVAGGGSTWHFLGGTVVSMILGPFGALISMTITLIIQALALGDGGVTSFGANVFNMAVIGALSFFIVKTFLSRKFNTKRLALSVFIASFISNVCTALAVGVEIGLFPMVGNLGGIAVTVPSMLVWYVPTGIIEGVVASSLVASLSSLRGVRLFGLELCKPKNKMIIR
jgi:cobalt/nickel transport system permease protein